MEGKQIWLIVAQALLAAALLLAVGLLELAPEARAALLAAARAMVGL